MQKAFFQSAVDQTQAKKYRQKFHGNDAPTQLRMWCKSLKTSELIFVSLRYRNALCLCVQ